jgi:imidazolonepropionase-like amidohydrolase
VASLTDNTRAVVACERWETGKGDGAGIYLAGSPKVRTRIGDFSEAGKVDSALASRRATLAAAAPRMLRALRGLVDGVERAAAAGVDLTGHLGVGDALSAIAEAEGR